jgi:hypothetical protein
MHSNLFAVSELRPVITVRRVKFGPVLSPAGEEPEKAFCPFCATHIEINRLDRCRSVFICHKVNPDTEPETDSKENCLASGMTLQEAEEMYGKLPISHSEEIPRPSDEHLGE